MKRIILEAVPAEQMRPPYCDGPEGGDWFYNGDGDLVVRVIGTNVIHNHSEFLFALHELIEAKLCRARGRTQMAVDNFDATFRGDGEPGDDPKCPYRAEHRRAMLIEHLMANFLGMDDYGKIL